jgi:DNA-binding HxlR family transcriptional regulator
MCPVAAALDLLGDRWTLLVLRDLFWGKQRFGEFLASPEQIPTNLLAERLVRLEQGGLIRSQLYLQRPPRYEYVLTEQGRGLLPTIKALAAWGEQHFPNTKAMKTAQSVVPAEPSRRSKPKQKLPPA